MFVSTYVRSVLGLSAYRPPDTICLAAIPALISIDSIKTIHSQSFLLNMVDKILQHELIERPAWGGRDGLIVDVNKLNVMTAGDTFMPSNSGHVPRIRHNCLIVQN